MSTRDLLCLARLAGTSWSAGRMYDKRYFNTTALNNVSMSTGHFSTPSIRTNIPFDKSQSLKETSSTTKTLTSAHVQVGTGNVDRPPDAGSTIVHSTQIETLSSLSPSPAQPTDVILKATVTTKDVDDALDSDTAFSSAQEVRKLEMTPAIPSTSRVRIDKAAEAETPQNSFTIYFTQPLKPVQSKQDVTGTGEYTLAAATAKPHASAAPKSTVVTPISTVEPNVQSEGLEATAHDTSTRMDSTANATIRGLLVDTSGTEKSTRHPFQRPSQTPSAEPDHQSSKGNQENSNPGTSAGIAIGTISLAALAGLAGFWAFLRYKRPGNSCENTSNGKWLGSLVESLRVFFHQNVKSSFNRNRGISEAKISAPFAQTNSLNW
ncbi:uncharacterized protein PgNI_12255 [Pyricularia grisea]|uniref:Uncharacterized protein n=1 Tax=Pyricularia grisea TaxID=148305 RepID=A0A6P8AMP8_PYRGI|nr:uncharacterized protein PgNI_12255 [Pyricularia grisea]TLD03296.1 hypothetical protein PgNI_12255 [Pyricularia grisea]